MRSLRGPENDLLRRRGAKARLLVNGKSDTGRPAPNGLDSLATLAAGRYSLNYVIADAISRGALRLARLIRRAIRKIGSRRNEIGPAVEGRLSASRDDASRSAAGHLLPSGRHAPADAA